MTKEEIIKGILDARSAFLATCQPIQKDLFFQQPQQKWSIAQNVRHLITSTNTTRIAYRLPKFIIRLYVGKPNRPSRSFDELLSKYKLKLEQGGKASGIYIPKPIPASFGKDQLLRDFDRSMQILAHSIDHKFTDAQLDQYIAPHPLLGKITHRELAYFTIFHTKHHQDIVVRLLTP